MHTSTDIGDISKALSAAQGELTNPVKNREVTVRPREGMPYSFAYATLDSILDLVRPVLAKHSLALLQVVEPRVENNGQQVTTRLLHASGQWIETSLPIQVEGNGNQKFGSALTYGRRYSIIALLALAAEEDDDGNAADGNEVQPQQGRQQPPPARQPTVTPKVTPVGGATAAAPSTTIAPTANRGPITAANACKEDCDAVFFKLIGEKGILHNDYRPLVLALWKSSTPWGPRWENLTSLHAAVEKIHKVMGGKAVDLIADVTLNQDIDRNKPTPEQGTAWFLAIAKMAETGEVHATQRDVAAEATAAGEEPPY